MMERKLIEELLDDNTVEQIVIHNPNEIWIYKTGELTKYPFVLTQEEMNLLVKEMLQESGREFSEDVSIYDFRIKDGSRVHMVQNNNKTYGITISKFATKQLTMEDLIQNKTLSEEAKDFLEKVVKGKSNILISGGTGAGKTTLLRIMGGYIPEEEKVVALEDSSEINLERTHYLSLEFHEAETGCASPTKKGIGGLVGLAFGWGTTDRILMGEFREGGALEMIYGTKSTNKSMMGTIHSIDPSQALNRLNHIASKSPFHYDEDEFKEAVGNHLDYIVQINRLKDGSRKITEIAQIMGYNTVSKEVDLKTLFVLHYDEETKTYVLKRNKEDI